MEKDHPQLLKYPRNVVVNFRKLDKPTLIRILRFYGVSPNQDLSQNEMAAMTARVFHTANVSEKDVVDKFATKFCDSPATQSNKQNIKKRGASAREQLDSSPARQGEQVAAKVSKSNENGSWILGSILEYYPGSQLYEVQDEDDLSRIMNLHVDDVKRLEDTTAHLQKGDKVLAVFPETTSFYRANVVKNPKAPGWEVIVRFEDDEDATGKAPARKVPARFVLRRGDVEGGEEDEEDS